MSGRITNEYKTFLLDPNHYVARDEYGHEGYGRTAEAAQHSLEEAQEQDVTFVSDSVTYGSSDPDDYDGFQARSYRTEQDDEPTDDVSADSSDRDLRRFDDDFDDEENDEKYEDDYDTGEEAEVTEAVDEPAHTLVHVDLIEPSEPEPETGEYVDMYLALHFAENEIAELVSTNRNAALEFERDYQTLRGQLFELKTALDRDGADLIVRWIALRELESLDRLHAYAYLTIRTTTAETSPPTPNTGTQNLIPDRLALIQKHLKFLKGEE